MGFIEDLRRRKEAAEQAQLMAKQNEKKERIASLERAKEEKLQTEKVKRLREKSWQMAKAHFEQTGVREMLNEIVSLKATISISEDKDNKPDKMNFSVELKISETKYESSSIMIVAYAEGTLIFSGVNGIAIPKKEWESDRSVLEKTLGVTYRHPHTFTFGSLPSENTSYGFKGERN